MYHLCAIGNALVDIILPASEDFLKENDIAKGGMMLVDDATSAALYGRAEAAVPGKVTLSSGGSAANTLAGFASLGGKAAYLGKVGRDSFGEVFTHDLHAQNIHFAAPSSPDLATGKCLIFVTPDAQRSMNTFLGAATEFGEADIDEAIIQNAAVTYLEGYLFDKPAAQAAFYKAAKIAHAADKKMALTLSDVFCVSRHRAAFLDLVRGAVDILFANENEIKALYETDDLQQALDKVAAHTEIAVVTLAEKGAVILAAGQVTPIAAQPVSAVVDTTGAGDLFAAGFLYGYTQGRTMAEAGRIGAIAAAEVISHYGPRPQKSLQTLL